MKRMQISHEVPLCMLEESLSFNDYQYCLVHLTDLRPLYKDFFMSLHSRGVPFILDNSVFELGSSYEPSRFIDKIIELQPTHYIIPDKLNDFSETLKLSDEFMNVAESKNLKKYAKSKSIGVLQGSNIDEFIICHNHHDNIINVDKVSISFGYTYYLQKALEDDIIKKMSKDFQLIYGRANLINTLKSEGVINYNKPYHLLGCSLPQEGSFYHGEDDCFIESMDSSSPIVHAIFGIKYSQFGLYEKVKTKLADLIDTKTEDMDRDILEYNISKFRSFWKV